MAPKLRTMSVIFLILSILANTQSQLFQIQTTDYKVHLEERSSTLNCLDNSSTGDCDNDTVTNGNEDRNFDGDWTNDDTDSDGIPNYLDSDDDNDGWPTWMECPLAHGENHSDCPGFGIVKDYLHNNLYNCDLPFIHLGYPNNPLEMKIFSFVEHNSTLIELLHLYGQAGANSDRSHIDGKLHWINSSDTGGLNHVTYNPIEGVVNQGTINLTEGIFRSDFDKDGILYGQTSSSLITLDISTKEVTLLGDFDIDTEGGGDLVIGHNDTIYLISSSGRIFYSDINSLNATVIGNLSDIDGFSSTGSVKGATMVQNGSLLFNAGENLFILSGEWTKGFNESGYLQTGEKLSIQQIHQSNDGNTGGDMASCLIPKNDQDSDGVPDFYEEKVFLTDVTNNDSDYDGLSDGDEILTYWTNPLNHDSDNDSCNDREEILIYMTNPLDFDSNNDGIKDCIMPTELTYQSPNYFFWDEGAISLIPDLLGHQPDVWNVTPSPPSWLSFQNGTFFGEPPSEFSNMTFTITCSGDGGALTELLEIQIRPPPPVITYQTQEFEYKLGDEIRIEYQSLRGPIVDWRIYGDIPGGIDFSNGNFSGIASGTGSYNLNIIANGLLLYEENIQSIATYNLTITILENTSNEIGIIDNGNNTSTNNSNVDEEENVDTDEDKPPESPISENYCHLIIILVVAITLGIYYRSRRRYKSASSHNEGDPTYDKE